MITMAKMHSEKFDRNFFTAAFDPLHGPRLIPALVEQRAEARMNIIR